MDIIILALLLATAVVIMRSTNRALVIGIWVITLVLMLGLFKYHVSDPLTLSF